MQLSQLQAFRVHVFADGRITEMRRNTFSKDETDAFIFEQRSCDGKVQHNFTVMESTAELSLKAALALVQNKPDLVSIEFDKLSTGASFNYPVPHV
jgi:hypothetical protein